MRQSSVSCLGQGRVSGPVMRILVIFAQLSIFCLVIAQPIVKPPLFFAQEQDIESVYSPLSGSKCKQLQKDPETGAAKDECVGVGGFRLLVLNDDDRSSVTVVTPEKKEFPLDYWNVVTHAFSSLGAKAEWRVARRGSKEMPIGLIVRVEYMDQSNVAAPQKRSVLSVAKIGPDQSCVVQIVKNGVDANTRARAAADNAATKACLEPQP